MEHSKRKLPAEMAASSADPRSAWDVKRLFYSVKKDDVTRIRLLEIGRGETRIVAESETGASLVTAAPDGKSLLLSSFTEESNIWRLSLAHLRMRPSFRAM